MKYILVHGLGLSSSIWSYLVPKLVGEVIAVDLPGHGKSRSRDYDWHGIWSTVSQSIDPKEWADTTLVLHSFTASLLPEIVAAKVFPEKIILIEGILHSDDAKWSNNLVSMDCHQFRNWLERFRVVSKMVLKSQLVLKHSIKDIHQWSNAFNIVKAEALHSMAIKLQKRLNTDAISHAISSLYIPTLYIRGESSRLSLIGQGFLKKNNIKVTKISKSAHFPMIDNPHRLANLIMG